MARLLHGSQERVVLLDSSNSQDVKVMALGARQTAPGTHKTHPLTQLKLDMYLLQMATGS